MKHLKISGKLQEINKESIATCLISAYERGEVFEEIEYCLECGCLISFESKLLKASGILIREIKSINASNLTEGLEISGEPIIMRFVIKSEDGPTHNITYGSVSKTNFVTTYHETDSVFMIILSKEFYFNLIHHTLESHKAFAGHIFNNATTNLFITDLPINPKIQGIINEIKNCGREGVFKRIFIENKVQELLLLQLELYQLQKNYKNIIGINEDDIAKLNQAKLILETNYTKAPTVRELAKKVFLNETKLRKAFKDYFDVTIKSYVISLKMKYALELLHTNKYNITEIATLCGYNGLVQFSVAFKKIYGCSPKKFNQQS
jgi:AraC-like DNA-binding protein